MASGQTIFYDKWGNLKTDLAQAEQKQHRINSISFYKGTPEGLSGALAESHFNDDNMSFNINIQTEKNDNLFINDDDCFHGLCSSLGTNEFLGSNRNY